jgi:hypothetical protein
MSIDQLYPSLDGSATSMSIMDAVQSNPLLVHRISRDLQQDPAYELDQNTPDQNYYQNQQQQNQQQQDQPQNDPNAQNSQYYQQPPNAEQTFYNDFKDKFQGFAGGHVEGAVDVDVSDAMVAVGFNATIFVALIFAYEIMSRLVPSVYSCRKFHVAEDRMAIDIPRSMLPFSWVPSVMRISWSIVRKCGGLDAYFFLRFIRMCFRITAVSGLWGLIILWPCFGSGGGDAEGWYHYSMANVRTGSSRIWFPTLFMWFMVRERSSNQKYKMQFLT